MKWFRHLANASDDEFIALLEDEFGIAGYGRWWKVLEVIAQQMDESDRCWAEYPISKWKGFLGEKWEKNLRSFLSFCEVNRKLVVTFSEKTLKISCPKLLELRDNHTKNLQVTGKLLTSKTTDTEVESNKPLTPLPVDNFLYQFKDLDLNNFLNCFEVVCLLFKKNKFSPKEQRELANWCEKYDMRGYALPLILEELTNFQNKNQGKVPNSIAYFSPILQKSARNKDFAKELSDKFKVC